MSTTVKCPAYLAIEKEAGRIGWPSAYKNDLLVHDYNRLHGDNPPSTFYWRVRESGTDLFEKKGDYTYIRQFNPEGFWFFWNGTKLTALKENLGL